MKLSALEYARTACDTLIGTYTHKDGKPASQENRSGAYGSFNYHDGVFLAGMERVYEITGDEKYYEAIKSYVDSYVDDEGVIHKARFSQLDDLMPTRLLMKIYEKTGEEKYLKAYNSVMDFYSTWHTNEFGGFWHKDINPDQMWLDSLYMGSPNIAIYAKKFDKKELFDVVYTQMKLMWDNMRDARTGLLYHCWDATKSVRWADPVTGLAPEFWGRALGWYTVTIFDLASYLPDSYEKKQEFIDNGVELIKSVLKYRDEKSKKWFQIVNRGNDPDNWLETSCSCLFTYTIAKGVNEGYLDASYKEIALECFNGVINDIKIEDGKIVIEDICVGTGVLFYDEYLKRPRSTNDLHGMGAFVLMCSEVAKLK